jgi:hypothetical protein
MKTTTKSYRYATDAEMGTITASSLPDAYHTLRREITPEMIADGATLWVESGDGERLTMGIDMD